MKTRLISLVLFAFLCGSLMAADTTYQPFILASVSDTSLEEQVAATIASLEQAGFTVAGQYSPLENTRVIVATDSELQGVAAKSDRGGYAAGQRISVTARDSGTEVAYINPLYIQHAYRLKGDMTGVLERLGAALGKVEAFGAKKKMTAKKLSKYNYMPMMQKFDDPSELNRFDSYEAAVEAVETGLAIDGDPLSLVYRIDIPGKEQTVFGVGMKATGQDEDEMDIDETFQMSIVDFDGYSKVAYFPYEILVNGPDVEALHMRFRMAVHFPDLDMMGEHGFTKLMASPKATEKAFEKLVGAE